MPDSSFDFVSSLPAFALASYSTKPDFEVEDARAVITETPDVLVIAIPGTHPDDPGDLFTDMAAAFRFNDPDFGLVAWSFNKRALQLWDAIRATTVLQSAKRVAVCGHSLGGVLARAVTGRMVLADIPPIWSDAYGLPRFGLDRFAAIVRPVPGNLYRRDQDDVPEVPPYFEHDRPLIEIGNAALSVLARHSCAGYVADIAALRLAQSPSVVLESHAP